jgi:hypothetical protein
MGGDADWPGLGRWVNPRPGAPATELPPLLATAERWQRSSRAGRRTSAGRLRPTTAILRSARDDPTLVVTCTRYQRVVLAGDLIRGSHATLIDQDSHKSATCPGAGLRGPCLQATSLADDALSSRGRVEASAEGCG